MKLFILFCEEDLGGLTSSFSVTSFKYFLKYILVNEFDYAS